MSNYLFLNHRFIYQVPEGQNEPPSIYNPEQFQENTLMSEGLENQEQLTQNIQGIQENTQQQCEQAITPQKTEVFSQSFRETDESINASEQANFMAILGSCKTLEEWNNKYEAIAKQVNDDLHAANTMKMKPNNSMEEFQATHAIKALYSIKKCVNELSFIGALPPDSTILKIAFQHLYSNKEISENSNAHGLLQRNIKGFEKMFKASFFYEKSREALVPPIVQNEKGEDVEGQLDVAQTVNQLIEAFKNPSNVEVSGAQIPLENNLENLEDLVRTELTNHIQNNPKGPIDYNTMLQMLENAEKEAQKNAPPPIPGQEFAKPHAITDSDQETPETPEDTQAVAA